MGKKVSTKQIKKLREATGAPIMSVKKVLEELGGNEKKAMEILKKEGFEKVETRKKRETSQGLIETYIHHSGQANSQRRQPVQ